MYEVMFYGGTALAIVFFLASVVLFIRNKVWKLIGDVTGWNARRAIKRLDKKGAEDTSKTEAIKPEVSKVLVHKATTTGILQAEPEQDESEGLKTPTKNKKAWRHRKKADSGTAVLQQDTAESNSVFEVLEDMVVLAGSPNDNVTSGEIPEQEYTTLLSQDDTGHETEEDEITTKLYQADVSAELSEDEPTDILSGDNGEITDVLATEEATDILVQEGDEATSLLVREGDEETTLLAGDDEEATTLLAREGDEETTLLTREGDEATTLLVREGEEGTSVLNSEGTRIEAEFTQFEPVLQDDEELMALLQEAGANQK